MDYLERVAHQTEWAASLRERWLATFISVLDDETQDSLEQLEQHLQQTTRQYIEIMHS